MINSTATRLHAVRSLSCTALISLSGCVTTAPMAFNKQTSQLDTTSKSIVLVTLDVSRKDESRFQPKPVAIRAKPPGSKQVRDVRNFKLNPKNDAIKEDGRDVYLVRMALEPGQYRLQDIFGMAGAFPINCALDIPLQLDFNLAPGTIAYAGRIKAVWRKREGNEFRAGPVLPLLDQSICGASDGTFDVEVMNAADKDIALFKNNFSVLNGANITTQTLPPFDKERARQWWDTGAEVGVSNK